MENLNLRFPGGKAKCLTLSYDDGVINDIRMLELWKKKGLKGTLNLNSGCYNDREYDDYTTRHRTLTKEKALALYRDCGQEIASHAVHHPSLEQLPPAKCTYEILQDRINHEHDYGGIVRGFAYPFGTYNDDVKVALKACGMAYARTVWSSHNFDIPKDWLELRPTCHHGDEKLTELTDRFLNEEPWGAPWLFYLWGHSYEFDFNNNWEIIENFADRVSGRDDIWYATNIEVYDYVESFKLLRFNAETTYVENPTTTKFWFRLNGTMYEIEPGGTLKLG